MATVDLNQIKNKPNPNVVKELEDILEQARNGEVVNFVLVAQMTGGCTLNSWAGAHDNVYTTFGRLMDMALMFRERSIE